MNYNKSGNFNSLSQKTKKLILIGLLFFISFFLINSNFDNLNFSKKIRAVSTDYSYFFSSLITSPVRIVVDGINTLENIGDIYHENKKLKQRQLDDSMSFQEIVSMKLKIQKYENLINFFDSASFDYISTRIITNINNNYIDSVILNVGMNQNITEGTPILGFKGLLGFVGKVNKKSSVGILLSDINSRVPVSISNLNLQGIMSGQNLKNPNILFAKDRDLIKIGDSVSTSGKGGIFPPYILIGEVVNVTKESIEVGLLEDIDNITHVRLIKSNTKN